MKHLIIIFYAWLLDLYKKPLLLSNTTIKLIYIPGFNDLRHFNSKVKAYAEFFKAKKRVPGYADFLKKHQFSMPSFTGWTPNVHEIPFTDKTNYVKEHSIASRCVNGKIPETGIVFDESSGSSGKATNWVRGTKERNRNATMIKFGIETLLGKEPIFVINAFALGSWATGINISMTSVKFAKTKSIGPDQAKIENTIEEFGKDHHYVIMGYPPFLKMLVDDSKIDWHSHNVSFIFGGESMSENLRDHLLSKGIRRVYSSLGASDLELNLAAENDFTISLRRLLRSNDVLRERLLQHTGALPMIFQYNPTDFLFETSADGELIVTVCRPDYLAPKIRYNIHDRGHTLQMKELYQIFDELNIDISTIVKPQADLPLLLHYGRADMTVSFFGSNISPVDVQEALFSLPELTDTVNSFCFNTVEDQEGNKQLVVNLEVQKNRKLSSINIESVQKRFFEELSRINQDFREARKMVKNIKQTGINLYEFSQGPFSENDIRIKARYIA